MRPASSLIIPAALAAFLPALPGATAPAAAQDPAFTRADSLRGGDGPARSWWDVTYYDLHVRVDPASRGIAGSNGITFRVTSDPPPSREMQIDLQPPMVLDSVVLDGARLALRRDGAAWFATLPTPPATGTVHTAVAWFQGTPTEAANPPWDGGFIWAEDGDGDPWVATANQGLGASVWWPNKDWQGEEPDSQRIAVTVPDPMVDVSNGRLRDVRRHGDGTATWEWFVASPINNYNVAVNAGSYAHWEETYHGIEGPLTLDFWPLEENLAEARRQWPGDTRTLLRCFEEWFGPFPWYEDGFTMVETPHLGMEHQSAIAYGNGYRNGYLGRDLSGTGQGLKWDFIIVHEAAHEWWGNNVTSRDVADMWVHEGFANYAENIFTECLTGSEAAGAEYVIGTRAAIRNDRPIIGTYGVQSEGSGDMYYKGGNLLHTIRQLVADDARWKSVLRGLQAEFRRQIVTSAQVEDYISESTGLALGPVFDQYLRTTRIPVLEWRLEGTTLAYRWTGVVEGFAMPVEVSLGAGHVLRLEPTGDWQSVQVPPAADRAGSGRPDTVAPDPRTVEVDPDWYVESRRVPGGGG